MKTLCFKNLSKLWFQILPQLLKVDEKLSWILCEMLKSPLGFNSTLDSHFYPDGLHILYSSNITSTTFIIIIIIFSQFSLFIIWYNPLPSLLLETWGKGRFFLECYWAYYIESFSEHVTLTGKRLHISKQWFPLCVCVCISSFFNHS